MSVALNGRVTGAGKPLIILHGLFGSMENLGALPNDWKTSGRSMPWTSATMVAHPTVTSWITRRWPRM